MSTDDRLPVRIPGRTLRITGKLPLSGDGCCEHASPVERPSYALLQRTLTGLQSCLHAAPGDSDRPRRQ